MKKKNKTKQKKKERKKERNLMVVAEFEPGT